jgi:phage-related minor tail protein
MQDDGGLGLRLDETRSQLEALNGLSERFGNSLSSAFARSVASGRSLDGVLQALRRTLVESSLRMALAPLQSLFGQLAGGLVKGVVGTALPNITPFAKGGIVAAPTYFPLGRGLGLMGERGTEAVMPLARGPDGRLGIAASGGGRAVNVVVNIATPDADSFRRSEAQVSAALARAVARGQRGL